VVGSLVGFADGADVGVSVVGTIVGSSDVVGALEGSTVGEEVGLSVPGALVGSGVGPWVGDLEGLFDGDQVVLLGVFVASVGIHVGASVGIVDVVLGPSVGDRVGPPVSLCEPSSGIVWQS